MRRRKLKAAVFGPPGAGKSLHTTLLAERFDVPLLLSGEAFRDETKEETALGKMAGQYVSAGMHAPDELANAIMARRLQEIDANEGFVIDGYPRNVEQAETLDRLAKVNLAIQLKITDATAARRLRQRLICRGCRGIVSRDGHADGSRSRPCPTCGGTLASHPKDQEDIVQLRLAAYHFMTEPLSGYYRQRGVLLAVNGEQTVEELFDELNRKLAKLGFVA